MNKCVYMSGLTAAGKTTHAKFLEYTYGLEYVSASSRLLKELQVDSNTIPSNYWISQASEDVRKQRRESRKADIAVDTQLVQASRHLEQVVFDTWGLPWLSSSPGLRIWLASTLETRAWKAYVSHGANGVYNHEYYEKEVKEKDVFSHEYFLETYGFDIFKNHDVFDVMLDISKFILEPTIEASRSSVEECNRIMGCIFEAYFTESKTALSDLDGFVKKHSTSVFLKLPSSIC